MTTLRIATRSLLRNRWRTALTAGGVAVAVALLVWAQHLTTSMLDTMVEAVTQVELGDAQVTSEAFVEEQNLYNAFPLAAAKMDAVLALGEIDGVAPRVVAFGLVGHEKHSQVARIQGVDSEAEKSVSQAPHLVLDGAWLGAAREPPPAAREVVLGKVLAEQLDVEVGQELVVLLQAANGSLGNDLLKVVGIVTTGSSTLDRIAVWMHIDDLQWLTALEGRVHQVVLRKHRGAELAGAVAAVREVLGPQARAVDGAPAPVEADGGIPALRVRSWKEIVPELDQLIELSRSSMWFYYIIVYLICALGILNTQRMTALERRRELGVLLAIGTSPGRMLRQVISEAGIVTLAGALAGGALGALLSFYHQEHGLDFTMGSGEGVSWMGVSFGVFYFDLNVWDVLVPVVAIVPVGLLCGLWPAVKSALLDIPRAISGRA